MNEPQTLEVVPATSEMQVARREVGPLSVQQVQAGLDAIHEVMKQCMEQGQDYGKVPGCGDKPSLFQPGAQKLSMMFQLNPEVKAETISDYPNMHRGYRLTVRVTNGQKFAEGVGECSTLESKYRFKSASRTCPNCGKPTIFKSKNPGEGFYCWQKKGGCGAKFAPNDEAITSQQEGKAEHDNPPDFWNTARKMAFKRAFVHAIINATNTSELWSQDLEDMGENAAATPPAASRPVQAAKQPETPKSQPADAPASNQPAPVPTEAHKARFLSLLTPIRDGALDYCRKSGILMENEILEEIPLGYVPATLEQKNEIMACIQTFIDGGEAKKPGYHNDDPLEKTLRNIKKATTDAAAEPWRAFPMPFGKQAGVKLEDLPKNYLFGLWANYKVETVYNGKPKKPETIAKDTVFRQMLDAAGIHYKFEKPEDNEVTP